jgi:hypothetical protein
MIRLIRVRDSFDENIKVTGAIFCHVSKIVPWVQLINSITWGNQKWVGAIPIFTPRATEINLLKEDITILDVILIKIKPDKIIKIDARAWVIKYLIDASDLEDDG